MRRHFSALTMFALAGNPLEGPPEGPAFFRSNYVIFGGPAFEIICVYGYQLKEVSGKIKLTILMVKLRICVTEGLSLLASFVEVWRIR